MNLAELLTIFLLREKSFYNLSKVNIEEEYSNLTWPV